MLHGQGMYLESARIQGVLGDRLPEMAAADAAWLAATFSRVSMAPGNRVLQAALDRLGETQRSDGGWDSADGEQFDVHTTLAAIRACRRAGPRARPALTGQHRVVLPPRGGRPPSPAPVRRSRRPGPAVSRAGGRRR